MPSGTPTPNLGIPTWAGNDTVQREGFNEIYQHIDEKAAAKEKVDEPFLLKAAAYDSLNDRINLIFGPGRAAFLGTLVAKTADSSTFINSPAPSISYYVYLKSDGTYVTNTTGLELNGAILIWKVTTGATVDEITTEDLRGRLPGAAAQIVRDQLDAHKAATPLDHPDNSVTDAKIGNRTADQAQVPSGSTGNLTQLLSWTANRIKAITGGSNWWDAPVATLAGIWAEFNGSTGHTHSGGANDGPKLPLSSLAADVATQAELDAHAGRTDNPHGVTAVQAGAIPDGADTVKDTHVDWGTGAGQVSLEDIPGAINDTKHGNRGGGSLHAAVVAGGASGFMTGSDKTKLDGIGAGANTKIASGSYTGNGTNTGRIITVGFTPKLVLIRNASSPDFYVLTNTVDSLELVSGVEVTSAHLVTNGFDVADGSATEANSFSSIFEWVAFV